MKAQPPPPPTKRTSESLVCRALIKALRPGKTKLVMLESPTNPRMQVRDPTL